MNSTQPYCYPTFSTINCGWQTANIDAAYAVWAALFVASCSSAGVVIGGLVTRFAHMGWQFNLMMETTLASIVAGILHIVLWLAPTIVRNGGTPYPTWLALLLWSVPFILIVRAQFMSFTTLYVSISTPAKSGCQNRNASLQRTETLLICNLDYCQCKQQWMDPRQGKSDSSHCSPPPWAPG